MNPQDKSDDEPEKTGPEKTGNANAAEADEGGPPRQADADTEQQDEQPSEPTPDPWASGEDAPEDTPEDGREAGELAQESENAAPESSPTRGAAEENTGTGTEDPSGSDEPQAIDLEQALGTSPLVSDGTQPEPEPESEAEPQPEAHESGDDEHSRSFASRVLVWLILLIVGAGLALWGGPKVAPHLPSGLGPVKAWLMPGAMRAEDQIAALADRVDDRMDSIEGSIPDPGVSEETLQTAIGDLEGRLSARVEDLADQVSATDREAIESRLTQLETRVEGLAAQVEDLGGLSGGAELSEENLAQINAFSASVEGLRAQIDTLAEKQGALAQRIEDVAAIAQRRIAEAEEEVAAAAEQAETTKSVALAQAAATEIRAALTAGEPYEEPLAQLRANTDAEIPEALAENASTGVAQLATLRESFSDAAHAAIRASIRATEDASLRRRLTSFLEAQVATRSLTPQPGDSTDAILSRSEDALRRDNLAAAVSELESLSEPARAAMQDWISTAEARVAARSALAGVTAALTGGN